MKKIIIVLLLTLAIATPSYAMNIVDKMLYKQVVLRNNNGTIILVSRLTGQVECVMSNGHKVSLTDAHKKQFQEVYNAQERSLRK